MSTLTLVRHAQASFFETNYDQLSPLGDDQSRLLGTFLARRRYPLHDVYVGPRSRHRRTAMLAGEAYSEAGFEWPEPVEIPELDEFQAGELLRTGTAMLSEKDPEVGELARRFLEAPDRSEEKVRSFQELFEVIVAEWVEGRVEPEGVDTWKQFSGRVTTGIRRILERSERGRNVAVFTSAGPIVATLQHVLELNPHNVWHLGWRIRNCSLTRFVFTSNRITLDEFNGVPHLDRPEHWTFR